MLVVPKREVSYIFDLTDEEYLALELFAKRVAEGMKEAVDCKRIGVAVIGLEVPYAHIHLIPITNEGDMSFSTKHTLPAGEMEALRSRIAEAVGRRIS